MVRLPDGEKNEDTFICVDRIHAHDRRTDGKTDKHCTTAKAALMRSIARQNKRYSLTLKLTKLKHLS